MLLAPRPIDRPFVLHTRVISNRGGGPEKTIFRSAQFVRATGYDMAAAYMRPMGSEPASMEFDVVRDQANRWGCPLFEVPDLGPLDPTCVVRMLRLCRRCRTTIWHAHDYKSNLLGLILRRFWPMKLVTTVHGWTWNTVRTRVYYHIDNWCLNRYDRVITVNPKLRSHCLAHGVPPDRLTFIPNGIDPHEHRPIRTATARRSLNVSPDHFVIGIVGRLSVEKGVDRAIRTLAALRADYPQVHLHMVGDGPQRAELANLAKELGVERAAHFHGWQTRTHRFYEAMNMLLLPSHTEGSPNTVLEAMASSVPVAATDVGGVRDLLDHGRCGVILDKSESDWPRLIAPLIVSSSRRHELALRARRRIRDHFTFRKRMASVIDVYDDLLGHRDHPVWRETRRAA